VRRLEDRERQFQRLLLTKTGSFSKCSATSSRQYNIAGGVVQFEATEGNSDNVAAKAGKIAHGKDSIDVAVLAENEIIDSSDRFVLVVDHRLKFERFGTIASCDLRGLQRCKCHFLSGCMIDRQRKNDGREDDRG
jgi:hypothetical protein